MLEFHHTTLDNGLEILVESNASAYSSSLGFFVKTGSRDETQSVAGVSHFLEHLVFKGTKTKNAQQINQLLDEIGADSNAFTSEEQTVFYGTVLPEFLDAFLELYADILRPALRQEDFDTEKLVVLEEIGMYEDQPPFGTDEISRELFFQDHPLANRVLGTVDSIIALTREQLANYFYQRYSPENIVLVGCGKLDFTHFAQQAEKLCGHWTGSEQTVNRQLRRVRGERKFQSISKENATLQYTLQLVDAPNATDSDRYAAELLACVLGDDTGSRLFWNLVDPGLVDSLGLSLYEFLDNGYFLTGMSCVAAVCQRNLELIAKIYRCAQENGVTPEELSRAKSKMLTRTVLDNERPRNRLFSVGNDWVMGRGYKPIREELHAIESVSLEHLHDVLLKYPFDEPLTLTIGPSFEQQPRT